MKEVVLYSYRIAIDYVFSGIPVEKTVVNTINPHSYVTAKADVAFKKALLSSDVLLPDGEGIVWAIKRRYGIHAQKIAGSDLHQMVLDKLNICGGRIFYLGASPETLSIIKSKMAGLYPNILVETYSPPYKESFSVEENQEMIRRINNFSPDILFVGMTAPKQEKWIDENKKQLNVKMISGIGAVFDFFAGTKKRPPQWMIKCKLEWLGRLLKEPKRMWRRNFVSTPLFIMDFLR